MVTIEKIHHVAYRCIDAKATVQWYKDKLNMELILAISENEVPSTKAPDPYMHVFLDAGMGNVLAFFELPTAADMGRDENTPLWVQHLALQVNNVNALIEAKASLENQGVDVLGPVNHGIFKSIYFFDPNGHRLELSANTGTEKQLQQLNSVAQKMIDEWAVTKRAPKDAAWLHQDIEE